MGRGQGLSPRGGRARGQLSRQGADGTRASRASFLFPLDIPAYSSIACARRAARLMGPGGSMVTMSYLGAVRAVPNYNVMGVAKAALEAATRYLAHDLGPEGIRVNAVSAGPIRTLAASGVSDFHKLMEKNARGAMLRRNVTQDEGGNAGAYLLSDWASGVTGAVHSVDAGFNIGGGDPGVEPAASGSSSGQATPPRPWGRGTRRGFP